MANQNNPLQPILDRIPAPFKNKYFLVLVLFVFWMVFFDRHDMLTQWRLQNSVEKLEEDKVAYESTGKKASDYVNEQAGATDLIFDYLKSLE